MQRGTTIHNELQKRDLVENNYLDQKSQALLDMHKSSYIVPWNALIAGYMQEGQALDYFKQMQRKGILPTEVILKACAATRSIDKGKEVHGEISRHGLLEHYIVLGNALVQHTMISLLLGVALATPMINLLPTFSHVKGLGISALSAPNPKPFTWERVFFPK